MSEIVPKITSEPGRGGSPAVPAAVDAEEARWRELVQHNADLADAQHAQSSPMCIYLLDMREFFRWDKGYALDQPLPRDRLGAWIGERERHWAAIRGDAVEQNPFLAVSPAHSADPFETASLRDALAERGLVYGAGIGRFGRPQFFLARLLARQTREGQAVLVCGEELARGSVAPPAMSRDGEILVRHDALERWLWARYEEWTLHPHANGFGAALALHDDGETGPIGAVRRMARSECESLILHELGERRIDGELGEVWHDLIEDLPTRKLEILARSVRDLFADCAVTLPTLLAREQTASIHLWFGLLDGVRQKLAPGLFDAYRPWCAGDESAFRSRLDAAAQHWRGAAQALIAAWRRRGADGLAELDDGGTLVFR